MVRISAQWGISRSTAPLSHASLHPPPSLPPYMHRHQDHTIFCVFFKLNTQFDPFIFEFFFCVDIFTYFYTFPKKATSRQRACFSILIFLLMFLLQQRLPSRKLDFVVSFWFRCLETSAHCAFLFVLINLKWVDRKWQMSKRSCFSFQSTT